MAGDGRELEKHLKKYFFPVFVCIYGQMAEAFAGAETTPPITTPAGVSSIEVGETVKDTSTTLVGTKQRWHRSYFGRALYALRNRFKHARSGTCFRGRRGGGDKRAIAFLQDRIRKRAKRKQLRKKPALCRHTVVPGRIYPITVPNKCPKECHVEDRGGRFILMYEKVFYCFVYLYAVCRLSPRNRLAEGTD